MPIRVRRATPADVSALLPLIERYCAADAHDFEQTRVRNGLGPLLDDDRHGQVWVLGDGEDDGEDLIGYAVLTWGWSLESGGREALLDEIYVDRRGEGLGSQLLGRVIDEARRAEAGVIFLETESANERARRLYRRHGFDTEDSVWLSYRLNS